MMEIRENEVDIPRMSGNDDSNVQTFDFFFVGKRVAVVHKRFNNAVTIQAMTEAVSRATMIPTNAAIEPSPTRSNTLRVVRRPTCSISRVP